QASRSQAGGRCPALQAATASNTHQELLTSSQLGINQQQETRMRPRDLINRLEQGTARLLSPLRALCQSSIVGTGPLGGRASVGCAGRAVAATAITMCFAATAAVAQKHGGTLRVYISANPSSLSILEEVSFTTVMAAGPLFNGLVVFDPLKPVGSIDTVIPELAESWTWDESGTKLTFKLRQGVKW